MIYVLLIVQFRFNTSHPVKNFGPPLEGDALEDGQDCEHKVVEVGDAEVGPLPVLPAHVALGLVTQVAATARSETR